jgi:CTP:molybdopterin cytidylyltransferase MocA
MNSSDIPIILLAAGQSSRMRGRDKLLEMVDGTPLLRRQAQMARSVTTRPVLVALPPAPHARYEVISDLALKPIAVTNAAEGMNASLRVAFAALPKDAKAVMLLLADLPELTEIDLKTCLQSVDIKSDKTIWRGVTSDGKAGHPIIFAASHFPSFATLSGDSGGREIVAAARDQTRFIPLPDQHARRDLDTPEDWEKWRARNPTR